MRPHVRTERREIKRNPQPPFSASLFCGKGSSQVPPGARVRYTYWLDIIFSILSAPPGPTYILYIHTHLCAYVLQGCEGDISSSYYRVDYRHEKHLEFSSHSASEYHSVHSDVSFFEFITTSGSMLLLGPPHEW